jgi:putative DNA primase/helicase
MTDMLTAALDYAKRGTPIFPVDPNNKRPLCSHGFHDATVNETVICAWWMRWPSAMIGMPTGPRTRLWVLDVDLELVAAIRKSHVMMRLLGIHGALPNTPSATTPRGGTHFFFRWDGTNIRNSVGKLGPGIDVRGHGGYVVIPPSVRSDGRGYRWDSCGANEPTEAPLWLIEEILKTQSRDLPVIDLNLVATPEPSGAAPSIRDRVWARTALEQECAIVVAAPIGERNATLNRAAFNLFQIVGGGYLGEQEVRTRLFDAADACGLVADDGAPQVLATIKSGACAGMKQPRHRPR